MHEATTAHWPSGNNCFCRVRRNKGRKSRACRTPLENTATFDWALKLGHSVPKNAYWVRLKLYEPQPQSVLFKVPSVKLPRRVMVSLGDKLI